LLIKKLLTINIGYKKLGFAKVNLERVFGVKIKDAATIFFIGA